MRQVLAMSAHSPQVRQPAVIQRRAVVSRKVSPVSRAKSVNRSVRHVTRSGAVSAMTVGMFSSCSILSRGFPCVEATKLSDSVRVGRKVVNEGKCAVDESGDSRASAASIRAISLAVGDFKSGVMVRVIGGGDATVWTWAAGCGAQTLYTSISTDITHSPSANIVGEYDLRCQLEFDVRNARTMASAIGSAAFTALSVSGSGQDADLAASIWSRKSATNTFRRVFFSPASRADSTHVIRTPSAVGAAVAVVSSSMDVGYPTGRTQFNAAKVAIADRHAAQAVNFPPAAKIIVSIVATVRRTHQAQRGTPTNNCPEGTLRPFRASFAGRARPRVQRRFHELDHARSAAAARVAKTAFVQAAQRKAAA
jgi:hypothetical protein